MLKSALGLFAAAGLMAGALSARAQSQPTGSWPSAQSYDTGNGFTVGGSASDGSSLYVLGGYWSGTTSFRRYDPVNDSWEDLPSLVEDNVYFRAAYVDGHIYVLGNGYYGNGEIYRYSIASRTWEGSFGTLENSRYQAGAAVLNNKIYVTGGWDRFFGGLSTALEVFDPADLTLTALSNAPVGLSLPLGVGMPQNNRVYFIGGQTENGDSSDCLEYDPAADTWQARATISNGVSTQTRYFPGGFALNGRVYLVGGNDQNVGYSDTTLEFTPMTNTWAQRASMNNARYGFAFGVIGGEGYVYGGESNGAWYTREQFVAPDFGSAPNLPATVVQVGSQASSSDQGGWTNSQITFQANVTDPDPGQLVRLEVQARPSGSQAWGAILSSGNGAQGLRSIVFNAPADGSYDWRWRVADALNNVTPSVDGIPSWVNAFDNSASPDFRSDQVDPTAPVAVSPANTDVQVTHPAGGPVTLSWIESTDNGPQSAITYEIQVSRNALFTSIEAQLFSTAGNTALEVTLAEARTDKFWRLRANDIGGNVSPWSNVQSFRVTFNDGVDHASGDAKKGCGFSAVAEAAGSLTAALFGLLLLAFAGRKVSKK
jgi:hypothetical protein